MSEFDKIVNLAAERSQMRLPEPAERKALRQRVGVAGDALARSLNIKPATLYRIERGEQEPTGELLANLMRFYRAAGYDERRTQNMHTLFGLTEGMPFTVDGTPIEVADLLQLLQRMSFGEPIVVEQPRAGEGISKRYDASATWAEEHSRLTFLARRGFCTSSGGVDPENDGGIVESFAITNDGLAALTQAKAAYGGD